MKMRHPIPLPPSELVGEDEWTGNHILPAGTLGSLSGTVEIDLDDGTVQSATLTGNTVFELPAVTADESEHLTLILTNGAGDIAITVTGVLWLGGEAPDLDDSNAAVNVIVLRGISGQWIADGGPAA